VLNTLIIQGDARHLPFADKSAHCCVTSPPYWGLRDYGTAKWEGGSLDCDHKPRSGSERADGGVIGAGIRCRDGIAGLTRTECKKCGAIRKDAQLGLESTPEEYISNMVQVFREVKRVLRDDGTLWLNMGDSYMGGGRGGGAENCKQRTNLGSLDAAPNQRCNGYKPKDLVGIPWMLAFALRADGWYLRSDIIWSKPNPMPESVTDRPTKAHEYIFLLSKSERYYYDAEAIAEPFNYPERTYNPDTSNHKTKELAKIGNRSTSALHDGRTQYGNPEIGRNKRTVWTVNTQAYSEAHFATFPEELIKPCILAGCPAGGVVLDPFMGSGTTALVARNLNCSAVGVELNAEYIEIAKKRLSQEVLQF
jgi:DNA modification methylase